MKLLRTAVIAAASLCPLITLADVIKTVQAGATDQTVTLRIFVLADGSCPSSITHDEAGMDLKYWRHGANAAVDITEATQTVNGAHSDGGFVELAAGTCEYRLDLPDAAVATGATAVEVYGTLTSHVIKGGTVQLSPPVGVVAWNGVALGTTNPLPNAVPGAAGGVLIAGTNADFNVTAQVNLADGLDIARSTSNASAFTATGNGTGHGLLVTSGSGATGDGARFLAASTNGNGWSGQGTGTGSGGIGTGGATGDGLEGVGGSTSGAGVRGAGAAGNSAGFSAAGQGSAAGFAMTGGATGAGLLLTGGSTSGNGLNISITAPLGPVPQLGIRESGTMQSGSTSTTAVLRSATNFTADDRIVGSTIEIIAGTGAGASLPIASYVNSTDTATMNGTWPTTPDNTSQYIVWATAPAASGGGGGDVTAIDGSEDAAENLKNAFQNPVFLN